MPQNGIFKEYDKNSNSIWDEAEIKDLQTCVQKFASKDGDIASLSRKEMKSFVGYLLSKSNNKQEKISIKDFFKKIQVLQKIYNPTYENMLQLNSFSSSDLDRVLQENEHFHILPSSDNKLEISSYRKEINYNYIFNKQGLIEYSTKENDEWSEAPFSKEFINEHIEDYNNSIVQDIINRRFDPSDWSKSEIEKMKITHQGKTTNIAKDENGYYSIEELNSNGENRILQSAELNTETNTLVLTKSATSPEGIHSEFLQDIRETSQIISYRITDASGNILLDKKSTLSKVDVSPETYNYTITEFNTTQTFEVLIAGNAITIKNLDNDSEHVINLVDYVQNNDNLNFFMNILKKVPANQLFLMSSEKLNDLIKADYLYDGGCKQNEDKFDIEIGKYDNDLSYFETFMHEYGHFIDNTSGNIGSNPELKEIYKTEYENFIKNSTRKDREILEHIVNGFVYEDKVPLAECVAEANALLTAGVTTSPNQLRLFHYQKYFPRTICKIEELIFNATQNR